MTIRPGLRARDVLLAAGCGVLCVGVFLVVPTLDGSGAPASVVRPGESGWWLVVALLLAQAVSLLPVRTWPRGAVVATSAAAPLAAIAGAGDATSVTSLAVVVATFVAATSRPLSGLWPHLLVAGALVAVGSALGAAWAGAPGPEAVGSGVLQAVGTLGLTLLVATVVATRREAARARESQVRAAAREQDALVQAAISRERTAMARELHDIAAHHLSGIAVMTAAIGTQIDTDPAGAKQAVQQVRAQSMAVLRDLRSLVGLLRDRDETTEVRPETLAGIGALVADLARAGRAVELTVLSDRPALGQGVGPLAQLAAYRAVQEALANAARHAPGAACRVVVDDRAPDRVEVAVRNGPGDPGTPRHPAYGGGFGLLGMRERAELTGSALEVGPTEDGGWQVTMRLAREETPT